MSKRIFWLRLFVFYTVIVILWGAWVRISHSGDGCGESWPLCQGEVVPTAGTHKTWVEFTHRLMSGSFGLIVIGIFLWARRRYPAGHPVRPVALASLILTITEALLGANLVLKGLVASNASGLRSFVMGLHFLNSAALVSSLTLLTLFATRTEWHRRDLSKLVPAAIFRKLPWIGGVMLLALGMTGTIAALSTTLFPSLSLFEGLQKDLSPESNFLLQLRALHPTLGVFGGVALVLLFFLFAETLENSEVQIRRATQIVAGLFATTIVIGTITLLWLSPLPLKLLHLGLAHSIVIAFTFWYHTLRYR